MEKRWSELGNTEDWDEEYGMCKRPVILHIGPCERRIEVGDDENREIWREWCSLFEKMESLRKRQEDHEEKKQMHSGIILRINVANFSEEKLEKRWSQLGNTENWDDEYEMCKRPVILHIGPYERRIEVGEDEYREIWRESCS